MVPDRGHGARRDHDALEEIGGAAERARHRRLDRIGMRDGDHAGARMTLDDPGERRGAARLHLGEGLAAGKTKPAGVPLHDLPFGLAGEPPKLLAGPLADVAVGQVAIDANGQAAQAGDRHRRLARSRPRSEEHTSELQSLAYLVCRLLLEKKKNNMLNDALVTL